MPGFSAGEYEEISLCGFRIDFAVEKNHAQG